MASFFQDLWESIFTPGPTPTLLVATNVTFACLQVVLAGLLAATYSVHFVILSALSGSLWYAINWFARELRESQEREERRERTTARQQSGGPPGGSESETEVETIVMRKQKTAEVEPLEPQGELKHRGVVAGAGVDAGTVIGADPTPLEAPASGGSKSGVSTEDEWEKVSESEDVKDK